MGKGQNAEAVQKLVETVHRLRAPNGCPWDRAQTHQSLRPFVIEEAHEVVDVLDQISTTDDLKNPKVKDAFREELGDLLMQVVLHAEMTREAGAFDFYDVVAGLDEKLIRRHPHVFGDQHADGPQAAIESWEKQKAKEKAAKADHSVLSGLPKGLPALQKTQRIIEKVTRVGFQWPDMQGPLDKLQEEVNELKEEVSRLEASAKKSGQKISDLSPDTKKKVSDELGDLLFNIVNIGFHFGVSAEDSLRGTLSKFERRFRFVEDRLKDAGKTPETSNLEEMDRYWDEAKKVERSKQS
ncbi:MAG: nucleoside triphosphate pyrophosphohydrolase [Bdellovibrionales bacterium]|nr:nucleoside triphosphate pyrophosphohydrolase [Bdellovibrionales bacterium]